MSALLAELHEEISCLHDFVAALEREREAMAEARFADLALITDQKTTLLDRIAVLDRRRETAQLAAGFAAGREGAKAMAFASDPKMRQAWSSLMDVAAQARDANAHNGSTVYSHLDFTQRALHFLRASTEPFYGRDGVRKSPASHRTPLALG